MKKLKIVNVESLGIRPVYDIEMPTEHNFILENGAVAHNCSYVYIARACAYLKYHYPAQWWAAVLTNASKEDLVGYWNSISKHVLPPDINSSSDQYQVKNADKINWQVVPPLNVIEGVGPAALGEILEKQPFSSVTDFMDRIDRRIVNKRVMLRLIFSGVLDRFFAPGADFLDKAQEYLNLKAKLEGKKTPEAIPEEYRDMTPLRRELMKKLVYKTYSTDFLKVQVPSLKTTGDLDIDVNTREMFFKSNGKRYELVNGKMAKRIIDGDDERTFQIAAYINDYKEHAYGPKKEKMMLKIGLEFEGIGLEIVQWPPWKKNLHGIQLPIDRAIAIVVLSKKPDRDPSVLEVKVLERVD